MLLEPSETSPWRRIASETSYENRWFRVRNDRVVGQDGELITEFTTIEWPYPIVSVVPIDENGNIYLVRQWRYSWGRSSWEAPAGRAEAGESPQTAARRELAEEAGYSADEWIELGCIRNSAQIDVEIYLFLARRLKSAKAERDSEEVDLVLRAVPLQEAVDAVMNGEIVHSTSISSILMAARYLETERQDQLR